MHGLTRASIASWPIGTRTRANRDQWHLKDTCELGELDPNDIERGEIVGTELLTAPIRAEHLELLPRIQELGHTATWIPTAPAPVVHEKVQKALEFLRDELIPHALVEEETLYPAVEGCMAAPGATDTMRRDHREVMRLTDELSAIRDELADPPTEAQRDRMAALLHGLHAIVALHFAKEEEIYLPILDSRLSPAEARRLFDGVEEVTRRHRPVAVV
jgi:iron-sulfur cluster repair protein YtfE (RIC family)